MVFHGARNKKRGISHSLRPHADMALLNEGDGLSHRLAHLQSDHDLVWRGGNVCVCVEWGAGEDGVVVEEEEEEKEEELGSVTFTEQTALANRNSTRGKMVWQ